LTELREASRREALGKGGGLFLGSLLSGGKDKDGQVANAAERTTFVTKNSENDSLLADLPMIRLRLPQAALGREYVALKLTIEEKGPYEFMVDTGLTTEMITPHLVQSLGIAETKNKVKGLAAGGGTSYPLVPLKKAVLCCGKFLNGRKELLLPI
jgi:hypothetical protein